MALVKRVREINEKNQQEAAASPTPHGPTLVRPRQSTQWNHEQTLLVSPRFNEVFNSWWIGAVITHWTHLFNQSFGLLVEKRKNTRRLFVLAAPPKPSLTHPPDPLAFARPHHAIHGKEKSSLSSFCFHLSIQVRVAHVTNESRPRAPCHFLLHSSPRWTNR